MESKRSVENSKQNPQERACLLSKLFYIWTLPIFSKGYKRDLTEDDLYKPLKSHNSHMLGNRLEHAWNHQVKIKNNSLVKSLWHIFKGEICGYISVYYVFCLTAKLLQPLLLMRVLNYYKPNDSSISLTEAYICTFAIILTTLMSSISGHTYVMGMQQLGIKIRVAICSLMYRKTLKLSKYAMNDTSTGQIVTLLSNDVRMFDYVMLELCLLVIAPSELIADALILYFFLGLTALVGLGFLLLIIPLQMYNGKLAATYRFKIATKTDQRILLMNEIISGIQVIKMYTWEKPFAKLIELARWSEMKQIRGAAYVNGVMHSYDMYMSRTAQFLCILTYVLTDHTLVAQYLYVLTSIYNSLTKTLSVNFPYSISTIAESKVSCRRIEHYLLLDEISTPIKEKKIQMNELKDVIGNNIHKIPAEVSLKKVSTKWDLTSQENALSDINFEAKQNDKIAIVGPVGSGKTTLINLLLKELPVLEGTAKINGKISYASQEPWLFTGSIRQNILFGETLYLPKYREVVRVCALEDDFDMFPFGDLSIVGERGVMLSGGQKARISLARAVYKDTDIYLLDDPLSAVDTRVGKQLFEQCISGYLADKCVILVTHQLQYLRSTDCIYLMENGTIAASGSYQYLQNSEKDFGPLMKNQPDEGGESQNTFSSKLNEAEEKEEDQDEPKNVKEHISTGSLSKHVYKKYFTSGGPWYCYISLAALFILSQLCASSGDYFLTFWVNLEQSRMMEEGASNDINRNDTTNSNVNQAASQTFFGISYLDYQHLINRNTCVYIYSGFILLIICLGLSKTLSFLQYCLSTSTALHNNMFAKLVKAPMRFFNTNPSGRILNRFSKDIGAIDEVLPYILIDAIEISITVIAVSIILSTINPWMLIPTFILLTLFYGYKHYYIQTSRSLKRIEGTTRSPVFSHMSASLQGLTTIRALQAQNVLIEEFDKHQDHHSSAYFMFLGCTRAFGMLLDFNCIIYVGIVTVSTFFTASLGGNVGLAITQALGLTGRMQWGVRQWSETENQMTSVERVIEYSELDPEEDNDNDPPRDWPEKGKIEFNSVSLRYSPQEDPILKNVTFKIAHKEKVGIVGRTGAGKSSTIAALFRLAPIEGSIMIDDINTKDLPLRILRSNISIIPQEPFLFSGTLRKNLDPFDEYDDNILWNALEQVELKQVIQDSSFGLNYKVSEGGNNFSVGQRQLICLARAITKKNKILILDEATANVDPKTDELIQSTIRRKFAECTVLTIAHRLHTVMDSDKVLVMDGGSAKEFDHPHILMQNTNGLLYRLVMETGKGMSDNLKRIAEETFKSDRQPSSKEKIA